MKSRFSVILFLIISFSAFAGNDLKVISSTRQSITIEYTPSYSDSSSVQINNQNYYKFSLFSGSLPKPNLWGVPSVQQRVLSIGVPSKSGNTIEIIGSSFKQINGKIAPIPRPVKDGNSDQLNYEISQEYSNYKQSSAIVSFGDFGLMRNIPVQSLIISPMRFDPGQNVITLYTKIIFKINYSSNQPAAAVPDGDFLKDVLINYDAAKYWAKSSASSKLNKTLVYNSVLSSGKWVRFECPVEGIYKITKSMLPSLGIDPSTVDPRTIKIYNNGGKILPEDPTASRPGDLVENAILFVGADPSKFGDNDYILLYGRGSDFWEFNSSSNSVRRFHNPYSNQNYYWITSGGANGKRIQAQATLNAANPYQQNSSPGFANWEQDEINIGQTGREYMGDKFDPATLSRTYTTTLDGRIDGTPINYSVRFINAYKDDLGFELDENGTPVYSQPLYGYGEESYVVGVPYSFNTTFTGALPGNRSLLKFSITPASSASVGYLDYFEIQYQKQLAAAADNLTFFSKDTTSIIQYHLTNFSSSNIQVFNVSDYANIKLISNPTISGGEYFFQAQEYSGDVSKYIAVGSNNFKTPINFVVMANSNLHGIQPGAEFIIITNSQLEDAAQRLKSYRENSAKIKISTDVVDVDKIFNEFSSGMVDPTAIRDFIEYAYFNWQIKPQYVLLFGKGTYDPKDVEQYHTDLIPTFQTEESLDLLGYYSFDNGSYLTDDYFAKVDGNDPYIDLAYGRIPAMTDADANSIVDKIIAYENNPEQGNWKNLISLVADDGWHGSDGYTDGSLFTDASEYLANYIIPSSFDINKVYLATYPAVITGSGRRIPDANKAIVSSINNGTLILNYIGHGNPNIWADEQVFVQNTTIPQLNNNKLFFLVAATCDFGRYDLTNSQSASEALLFLKNAGCIAAFSSSRLVYASYNNNLTYRYFSDVLTTFRDTLNLPLPLGKLTYITKQSSFQVNDQKYELLGDPTLRLGMAQYSASIDSIDHLSAAGSSIQIKALSNVNIAGEIKKPDNTVWSDFNGKGILSVFDSQRQTPLPALGNYLMTIPGGLIFNGQISITNGKFNTSFIVPKDISYEDKTGKIVLYFYDNSNSSDGVGFTSNIIVGGTDSTAVNNHIGPSIKIYFDNDSTSANTGLINPNSTLFVKLLANNGLNTTGTGVGHKLEGILNDQNNNPIDFTNYFTGDLNSGGKSGQIKYPFNGIDLGNYKLKVSAWDVFNNSSSETVYFTVISGEGLAIKNIFNYPDPFNSSTTFTFQQNLNQALNVKIRIYSVAGRLIRQIEQNGIDEKFVKIPWDGRDQDGDLVANGAYLYKVFVETEDGKYNQSAFGKLAVIR